ncbi:MAG: Flp pilus assembly protein CpaB [Chloroflexota bacterium]|nr:Flp pilus assembly protein CpaB [Chloroflexota bacterium]MDQ5866081.1 Flp pilus assembly protein CpaB [Chloroflexota bacterium]
MKARGGRFLLILGAGLAVMSFVVVYVLMSRSSLLAPGESANAVPTPPPVANVVVVSKAVPAYTVLDESNVALKEVEATTLTDDSVTETSVVFGKMTTAPLTAGQQVRQDQLTQSGFSNILARGEKAFALPILPRNAFGGALTEGDRIDVLWSAALKLKYEVAPDGTVKETTDVMSTTKALLQNIKILRVINLEQPAPARQGDSEVEPVLTRPGSVQTSAMYNGETGYQQVLILGVTDQQAEVLKFAMEGGIIDLTLRSSAVQKDAEGKEIMGADGNPVRGDQEIEKTTGITINTLIEQYGVMPVPQTQR